MSTSPAYPPAAAMASPTRLGSGNSWRPGEVTAPSMSTTIVVFASEPDTNDGPGERAMSATPRGSNGGALDSTAAPPVGRVAQIANPDVAQTTATIAAINQRGTASSPGVAGCEGRCPASSSAS